MTTLPPLISGPTGTGPRAVPAGDPLIEFSGVGKRFRRTAGCYGLKDWLAQRVRRRGRETRATGWTDALRNVSFCLHRGEALALLGRNGSGKSTVLSLAAGVLRPTTGRVTIRGRVSPLLGLGAGVHPDLTGRENVYLNGVLLGLTRREVRARFGAIEAFAELGELMEQPVRYYSSGMLARLGFSVATHLDPELLIVDEILAVGDAAFQAKCYARIAEQRARGLTMLYVSHEVSTVLKLCDRVLYLQGGRVAAQGAPQAVCGRYYADQGLTLGPATSEPAMQGEAPCAS